MIAGSYLEAHSNLLANAALEQAIALQRPLIVRTLQPGSTLLVDGIRRGRSPTVLHLFASEYDLAARSDMGGHNGEWVGHAYTDSAHGTVHSMLLNPTSVSDYARLGPVADIDRDWLADTWEQTMFGSLGYGPQDDPYHTGLANLYKHWYSAQVEATDSDGDGMSDSDEVDRYGSDPTVPNAFYYVNDAQPTGDQWCTASGHNANDGRSPATPKASLEAVLAASALGPGAVVCVDAGTYPMASSATLTALQGGSDTLGVIVQGADVAPVLRHTRASPGSACLELHGVTNVLVRSLHLEGGYYGLLVTTSTCCRIEGVDLRHNAQAGLVSIGLNTNLTIRNVLAVGGVQGVALSSLGTNSGATLRHCTFAGSTDSGLVCSNSAVDVQDSIFVVSGAGARCLRSDSSKLVSTFDHNCYHPIDGAQLARLGATDYPALTNWLSVSRQEVHSISLDPLFVGGADFHLQSQNGSYHGGSWTPDDQTSFCIDTASPFAPFDREPAPRSVRANLGRYGGTAEASKTGPHRLLRLIRPIGGEQLAGVEPVRWLAPGGWTPSDTLRVDYTSDNGRTWKTAADMVDPRAGVYLWDTAAALPNCGPLFRVRVTCVQQPTVTDQSSLGFDLRNGGLEPPAIRTQPQSQTNLVGRTAVFGVIAAGTPPLFYQWQMNGVNLMGATNQALAVPNLTLASAGDYSVTISNACCAVNSMNARLTVLPVTTQVYGTTAPLTIISQGAALPYPASLQVQDVSRPVAGVAVTLRGLSHTFPDHLDVLLVGPQGHKVMLMSDVGGSQNLVNATLTVDDFAAEGFPDSAPILARRYRPTDCETADALPGRAPGRPYSTSLSVFEGVDPNGQWLLYVADDTTSDGGTLSGGGPWNSRSQCSRTHRHSCPR